MKSGASSYLIDSKQVDLLELKINTIVQSQKHQPFLSGAQTMRYLVVGTSGAGKTTFARELSIALAVPHVELDDLHWSADWTPRPRDEFIQLVEKAAAGDGWVVDGNYSAARDSLWPRATHVVWLNFSLWVVFPRVVWRTLKRTLLRQPLWHGNRESIRQAFFSRDSILLWSVKTFGKNRFKYAALMNTPEYSQLSWIELRNPDEAAKFLAGCART